MATCVGCRAPVTPGGQFCGACGTPVAGPAPVYGFDPGTPGFFWCAGQGGFGIQTAPAAAKVAAALLLGRAPDASVAQIDPLRYAPARFHARS